jgi:hypothetical protein
MEVALVRRRGPDELTLGNRGRELLRTLAATAVEEVDPELHPGRIPLRIEEVVADGHDAAPELLGGDRQEAQDWSVIGVEGDAGGDAPGSFAGEIPEYELHAHPALEARAAQLAELILEEIRHHEREVPARARAGSAGEALGKAVPDLPSQWDVAQLSIGRNLDGLERHQVRFLVDDLEGGGDQVGPRRELETPQSGRRIPRA